MGDFASYSEAKRGQWVTTNPVEIQSGCRGSDLGAYLELRDQKARFFTRFLA